MALGIDRIASERKGMRGVQSCLCKKWPSLEALLTILLVMDPADGYAAMEAVGPPARWAATGILTVLGLLLFVTGCVSGYLFRRRSPVGAVASEKIHAQIDGVRSQAATGEDGLILGGIDHRLEEKILLSAVIEQTEDNVLISDAGRTIIYVNPAFERSSGFSLHELKGKPMGFLRSDQHDEAFFNALRTTLDRGEIWMGTIVNKGRAGMEFEIEGTRSPIKDDTGRITHWVAIGRNMSRFRKLERELLRAQKMDALGTLAGGIAHDFNNILAAVMGMIEMECIEARAESKTRRRMEQAMAACARARDLVKQILAFSSQAVQRRRPLRMSTVIEDALQMLRATLPASISIKQELTAVDGLILGDSTQIHQTVVNLCTNAVHAMRNSGGVLGIRLNEVHLDGGQHLEHQGLRPGAYLVLTVSDTGAGMDEHIRERIFEPFFSTKKAGEGAGVGLSVVHGIVKGHGGTIRVSSELGKGSVFDIYFPKVEGIEDLHEKEDIPPPSRGHEHILLVDDEELVVTVATEMLHSLGYQVVSFQRSVEALEMFRTKGDIFHLIITDQTMPDMTGIEFACELRRIRSDIPIILCTGFSDDNIGKMAAELGIDKILSKPFVMQELATIVREVLDRKV